jgi:hypothetical protein
MTKGIYKFPDTWKNLFYSLLYITNKRGFKRERFNLKQPFENSIFIYRPYYDGECNCGYIENREKIYETEHDELCPTKFLTDLCILYLNFQMDGDTIKKLIKIETERMGLGYNSNAEFDYYCYCSWKNRIKKWDSINDHLSTCSIVLPNFYYKKTGFKIFCGKKNFTGLAMNQNITSGEFKEIIKNCCKSIKNV